MNWAYRCHYYDRVLKISTDLSTKICKYYDRLNTVCLPQLKKGVFTTSAVDNINHQTSATTAKSSFNGAGISVFQHGISAESEPAMPLEESPDCTIATTNLSRKSLPKLPLSYTRVPPMTGGKLSCAIPSLAKPVTTECPLVAPSIKLEYRYKLIILVPFYLNACSLFLQVAAARLYSCQYRSWHIQCVLVSFPCKS